MPEFCFNLLNWAAVVTDEFWREFSPARKIAKQGHHFLRREIAAAGYRST